MSQSLKVEPMIYCPTCEKPVYAFKADSFYCSQFQSFSFLSTETVCDIVFAIFLNIVNFLNRSDFPSEVQAFGGKRDLVVYCLCLLGENIIANPLLVLFSRQMRDYLSGFQEQCDAILNDVNNALQHLESLQKQYLFVSNKTGALHEACEQLLKEQVIWSRRECQ